MPRTRHSILTAAAILAATSIAAADDEALRSEIDTIVQGYIDTQQAVGIVVGVARPDGNLVTGYGRSHRERESPPGPDTIFEIGSVTKVFTSLLLAQLAEDGTVSLDVPIREYLPETVPVPRRGMREITLRHLATHTSGLPRIPLGLAFAAPDNPYAAFGNEQLYQFLGEVELLSDVGENFAYSNVGAGLLGHILSLRSGESYEALVLARICEPLGMHDTRITLDDGSRGRLAAGHAASGEPTGNWDFDVLAPAGALKSTAADMLRFAAANVGLIDTPLKQAMEACHQVQTHDDDSERSIGLAWIIEKLPESEVEVIWHNGGTGGYSSNLGLLKTRQCAVVVLCNTTIGPRGSVADQVGLGIAKILARDP